MLTARQQQVLDFLRDHHQQTGLMPSTREIQRHFGFASQTAAVAVLRALERKGVVQRWPGKARALVLKDRGEPALAADRTQLTLPLLGSIPAGMPSDAGAESGETLTISPAVTGITRPAGAFALRVRGDSMTGAHILDGDCVFLEKRTARHGDVVAALIDGETTLKRFVNEDGNAWLRAENPAYPSLLPAHELVIQGVMTGLLRKVRGSAAEAAVS